MVEKVMKYIEENIIGMDMEEERYMILRKKLWIEE